MAEPEFVPVVFAESYKARIALIVVLKGKVWSTVRKDRIRNDRRAVVPDLSVRDGEKISA